MSLNLLKIWTWTLIGAQHFVLKSLFKWCHNELITSHKLISNINMDQPCFHCINLSLQKVLILQILKWSAKMMTDLNRFPWISNCFGKHLFITTVYSQVPLWHGALYHDITYNNTMSRAKHKSDLEITTDIPHLSLTASYGVSVVRILQKNDCIITALYCISVYSAHYVHYTTYLELWRILNPSCRQQTPP